MVELISNHKIGLSLTSPVLIAAGFGGYGNAYRHLVDMALFGAVVTRPITLRPQRFTPQATEITNGLLIDAGRHNPGVKKVLRRYGSLWAQLPLPVIAHLPADEPSALTRTARALSHNASIVGIELGFPTDTFPVDIFDCITAVRAGSELPLLVKMPFEASIDLFAAATDAGANSLVFSAAPHGTIYQQKHDFSGEMYGTAIHPLILYRLQRLISDAPLPVVAAGGIHSVADARAYLKAGALAVQLDSILFVNPRQAEEIARLIGEEEEWHDH